MTTLEALRIMRKGVLEQGCPSRKGEGDDCYYWKDGLKCPIGMLFPNEDLEEIAEHIGGYNTIRHQMYRPWMDGLDPDTMLEAQDLHDGLPDEGWLVHMVRGLDNLIKRSPSA